MDFEEAKRRLKLVVVLCVVGYGGWYLVMQSLDKTVQRQQEETGEYGSADRENKISERITSADALGHKDPIAGLQAIRDILAAPRDDAEKALALHRMPGILIFAHRAAGQAKDWPRQASLWAEIYASTESDRSRFQTIEYDRSSWLARALTEGDDAAADHLAAGMRNSTANDEVRARGVLSDWRDRQFAKWRAARVAKNPAAAAVALEAMASWEPLESRLPGSIITVANKAELLTLAKSSLNARSYGAAALMALSALNSGGDEREARLLLDDALMGLASDQALPRFTHSGWPSALEILGRVSGKRRPEALARSAGILEDWADSLMATKPQSCDDYYRRALDSLKEIARIESRPLSADVEKRLTEKIAESKFISTLNKLPSDTENAFAELRPLLREGKDLARRERAVAALRDAWRQARDTDTFDRLVNLTAYWIAEVGTPAFSDPFRNELKLGLTVLAEKSKKEALNKQVFALTLLADAFPDDPQARESRREAATQGAKLARETTNRGAASPAIGISALPGRTIALIENGTEAHIMMIYAGPENFFVRINPYRRGTVVLKDGQYLVGVATVKDDITPYAFETALTSKVVRQRFVVVISGQHGNTQQNFGYSSYGDWTLLRAPEGEKHEVNPQNGMILTATPR